jgi:serine/threonine protein kinase
MGETDKFEHFVIARRDDGSLWELGRGAMGVTYKAFDTNLRADVALKVINSHFLNSETARQRFLREARAAASLRHPNVATVFHLGNVEGGFFYAMEYVEGETVERRVQREGPLSSDLALRITRQVSRALIAADRQKLVHRDIKPSNLMLVVDDDEDHLLVKVIDFGLAKSLVAAVEQSLTISMGGFVGTPHFASPEQLEEKEIDIRSDIYSLGATLWFMLTGRPPFQGSLLSVINQHLSQPLSPEVLAQLHPRLAALLEKMLAKRLEDRFQSPTELKRQIDEILNDLRGEPRTVSRSDGPPGANDQALRMPIGTSSFGFATGELIRERYEIHGRSPFDNCQFKAKDLQTNRIVTLRQLPLSLKNDTAQFELLRRQIERIKAARHPNLLELFGLETYERGLFIVSEWIKGFSLQDLLRVRRALVWEEALRIATPLAKVQDFAAGKELLGGHLFLRDVSVETPRAIEDSSQFQRTPVTAWPPFIVKVDPLSFQGNLPRASVEPAQTLVDSGGVDAGATHVQQLAGIVHELLGGVRTGAGPSGPRLNPVASLSERGNAILRAGATKPNRFTFAADFLAELEAAQAANQALAVLPAMPLKEQPALVHTPPAPGPSAVAETPEDNHPKTSPVLLRILLAAVGLFLVCAVGAVIGTNLFLHKPAPQQPFSTIGTLALTSKPDGASVNWNGKEIGKTPLDSYPLPAGKYTLELSLPGYATRSVDLEITQGSLNNLGLIPLMRAVGQLSLKSEPANLPVEVIDPSQKLSVGNTPMTLDNLPVGNYTVRIKRTGWPDYVQQVSVRANAAASVEHTFKGANVTLKSDPTGATISLGQTELGNTPLTVELPPRPVELVSRIGALAPVARQVVPDASGSTMIEFKHEYGTVSLTSDRSDAEVIVEGINLGRAPIEGIMPPGQHRIVVRAPGAADETRTVDVAPGQRLAMEINFNAASRAAAGLNPKPAESNDASGNTDEGTMDQRQAPRYRTKDDYDHARDAAYDRFDSDWEARKNALKRAKDYYDYQADHSDGAAKERWKRKKDEADRQLDQLDDQKDAAKKTLKHQWNDD